MSINGDDGICMERLTRSFVKGRGEASNLVADAIADSFKRLLKPSIETEFAQSSKEKADEEAIRIFATIPIILVLVIPRSLFIAVFESVSFIFFYLLAFFALTIN